MNMTMVVILLFLAGLAGCIVSPRSNAPPPRPVDHVDLERYCGEWYEIARYPNRFQRNCPASKATYTLLSDDKIEVLNQCYDKNYQKVLRSVRGKAWPVDNGNNARLKVSFFWPFSGDYWIIDLGKNYEYAVVGHPTRKYLWILSRKHWMEEDLFQEIAERLRIQGYDPDRLILKESRGQGNES